MSLNRFQTELEKTDCGDYLLDFCRKKVLHGNPHVFAGREDDYFDFRNLIAKKFQISFLDVHITGSGKLGFSALKKTLFDLNSDIDTALISEQLFDRFMCKIYRFERGLRAFEIKVTEKEMANYHNFLRYTALGWIRPDLLPVGFQMKAIKHQWFEFFRSISYGKSSVGDYKVSAGIFKSYEHFEAYTMNGLNQLKSSKVALKGELYE